jgi:hypothetical protein
LALKAVWFISAVIGSGRLTACCLLCLEPIAKLFRNAKEFGSAVALASIGCIKDGIASGRIAVTENRRAATIMESPHIMGFVVAFRQSG